ncbi:MAG: toll/interleukin-1 receptor domain-containing protein [Myxococcales bacterium]|nr:toll/interleukin-1 receptor domain-containing protein [Myxococcales bacterium]HQY64063.1 toll/interleukin-1 receptor domain-containing protein [Polyangiaceae bacterium]
MVGLIEELRAIEKSCEDAGARLAKPKFGKAIEKLRESVKRAQAAFSGSWIGYHASTYIRDLRSKRPSDVFDAEWGLESGFSTATAGDWVMYDRDGLESVLLERASVSEKEMSQMETDAKAVGAVFDKAKEELLPLLDALLAEGHEPVREPRDALKKMKSHVSVANLVAATKPQRCGSRDQAAMAGGWVVPVHAMLGFRVEELASYRTRASELAGHIRQVRKYLERRSALAHATKSDPGVGSDPMGKSGGGWDPKSFEDVVAQLDASTMKIALNVKGTRTCPAPRWDADRTYRVALVGDTPTVQRLIDGTWENAALEPPREGVTMAKKERTTDTRLFVSHAFDDLELAQKFTDLVDGTLTVPRHWMRCTSVVGFKLEPGADGPDELRDNLEGSDVVVGLLTPASLASVYVQMELGAAWGLKSWVVPVLGVGVGFKQIPGPIGRGVHGLSVTDEEGIASLLETISTRCKMEWRVGADRRHALVKAFVAFASKYHGKPPSSASAAAPAAPPAPAEPPPPADMSEGDRVGRLRIWLHDIEDRDDPRTKGKPFPLADIDGEAKVPPGTAQKYLEKAMDQDWEILRQDGSFIEILYSPKVRDVRGSRRYR